MGAENSTLGDMQGAWGVLQGTEVRMSRDAIW